MITIRTAKGEEFKIAWAGVATIDGVLRFAVVGAELPAIIEAFTNPDNCAQLTRVFDNNEMTFDGYTVFRGVQIQYDDSVIVSMSKI